MVTVPVTFPSSPEKSRSGQISNIGVDVSAVVDSTPVAPRDLYRTCLVDELRQTPYGATPENDRAVLVNRSIQAFNTPFPLRPIADVVRVVSEIDDTSKESDTSSGSDKQAEPLKPFRISTSVKPASLTVSLIPPADDENSALNLPVSNPPLELVQPEEVMPSTSNEPEQLERPASANGSVEPPLLSPPRLSDVDVEYSSWSLLPTNKFSGFFIRGKNIASGNIANSSRIIERIEPNVVKSKSGSVIRLVGSINEKNTLRFFISMALVSAFENGFPSDWKELVSSEMVRLKEAPDKIRSRILSLLEDIAQRREPMSHSMTSSSLSLLSSQLSQSGQTKSVRASSVLLSGKSTKTDNDKAIKLPTIEETPDNEQPRYESNNFPFETRKSKVTFQYAEEEDSEAHDEGELESSASLIETADLSDDGRQHYGRRRARQGNKAESAREALAAKSNGRSKKPVAVSKTGKGRKKSRPEETSSVTARQSTRKPVLKKMDITNNSFSNEWMGRQLHRTASKQRVVTAKKVPSEVASNKREIKVSQRQPDGKKSAKARQPKQKEKTKNARKMESDESLESVSPSQRTKSAEKVMEASKSKARPTRGKQSKQEDKLEDARKRKAREPPPPVSTAKRTKSAEKVDEASKIEVKPTGGRQLRHKGKAEDAKKEQGEEVSALISISSDTEEKDNGASKFKAKPTRGRQPKASSDNVIEKLSERPSTRAAARKASVTISACFGSLEPTRGRRGKTGVSAETQSRQTKTSTKKSPPKIKDPFVFVVPLEAEAIKSHSRKKRGNKQEQPVQRDHSHYPIRHPNPLRSTSNANKAGESRGWSEAEIDRLKRAVIQTPINVPNYWKAVANVVSTRSEGECFQMYNRRMDIQKAAHCTMMFDKLPTDPNTTLSSLSPAESKSAETKTVKKKTITAASGTLKRREQIRDIVQEEAKEKWNERADTSYHSGGLTQSERAALLGGNGGMTPSAEPGSSTMVTAGAQGLSAFCNEVPGQANVSSAFAMPDAKKRRDHDKEVKFIRDSGKQKKGKKATAPARSLRKKALQFDHLSPVGHKPKQFLPQSMSTPNVAIHYQDDSDDTLTEISSIGRR